MKRVVVLLLLLVLIATLGGGAAYVVSERTAEPFRGYVESERLVDIPTGTSTPGISSQKGHSRAAVEWAVQECLQTSLLIESPINKSVQLPGRLPNTVQTRETDVSVIGVRGYPKS